MSTPLPLTRGDTFALSRVSWVRASSLDALIEHIGRADRISFDLETTGLDEHATRGGASNGGVAARVVLASLTVATTADRPGTGHTDPVTYLLPLSHPEGEFSKHWRAVFARVARAMADSDATIYAHNGKYDFRWTFAHTGVSLSLLLSWDSQIGAHLIDENSSTKLKNWCEAQFDISNWGDDLDLSFPGAAERYPLIVLGEYAARDTYWTWRACEAQQYLLGRYVEAWERPGDRDELQAWRVGDLAQGIAMPTVTSLTMVEQRGFLLDVDWTRAEIDRMTTLRDASYVELLNTPYAPDEGTPSTSSNSKWFLSLTEEAVRAGDLQVITTTPKGAPQWTKYVLTRNATHGSPLAPHILDIRHATKRLEYLNSWLDAVTPAGTVHTSYHSGRVLTGRLSSSSPNFQQITSTLKPAYIPRDGFLIAELDYSQIELRAAAFVARCEPMMEAYREGRDLHRLMGSAIAGCSYEDVTAEQRQQAKSANFGLLYGQGAPGYRNYAEMNYGVVLTEEEAEESWEAFFTQWTGMAEWQRDAVQNAYDYGFVTSPLGRVRRLPLIRSSNVWQSSHAERQAMNSPVQSFASDLMQAAIADVQGVLGERVEGVMVLGTVHDSVVVETPVEGAQERLEEVMARMIYPHRHLEPLGCHLDVPLAVEASLGTRWGLNDLGTLVMTGA